MEPGRDHQIAPGVSAAARRLDPWGSALEEPKDAEAKEINGDRAMGIAQYFQREPLDWRPLPLDDETFKMLCAVGYDNDGECEY